MEISESNNRNIKIKRNSIFLLLLKGGSLLISLIYVPLLLNTLKSTEYAVWLTLTSIVGWLVITDIGLGNGLRNKLAECIAKGNLNLGKQYVSTAYIALCSLLMIILILILLFTPIIDWSRVLNASDINTKDLNILVTIVFASFCIHFSLSLLNSVLLAIQQPALSSALGFIGQLLSFIIIYILVTVYSVNSLLFIGSIISLVPVIVYIFANLVFFYKHQEIAPTYKNFRKLLLKDILVLGIKFFFLQLIGIILFYSNNIIITHAVGDDGVVGYNIAYKYMNCIYMIFTIIATPIWSATTEAFTKGDYSWIKSINSKLLRVVIILLAIGIIMLIVSPVVYKIWLGKVEYFNWLTLSLLLLYFIFLSIYGCYGFILNGMGKLKLQIIITSTLAFLYVPTAYILGLHFGLNGILTIFLLNQIVNSLWSKIQFNKVITRNATGIWNA